MSPPRDSTDLVGRGRELHTLGGRIQIDDIRLDDSILSCDDADGYLDGGEHGEVRFTVRNLGASTLTGLAADLASTNPTVIFPDGATVPLPDLAPFASAEVVTRAV